jgi:hypothetical protein
MLCCPPGTTPHLLLAAACGRKWQLTLRAHLAVTLKCICGMGGEGGEEGKAGCEVICLSDVVCMQTCPAMGRPVRCGACNNLAECVNPDVHRTCCPAYRGLAMSHVCRVCVVCCSHPLLPPSDGPAAVRLSVILKCVQACWPCWLLYCSTSVHRLSCDSMQVLQRQHHVAGGGAMYRTAPWQGCSDGSGQGDTPCMCCPCTWQICSCAAAEHGGAVLPADCVPTHPAGSGHHGVMSPAGRPVHDRRCLCQVMHHNGSIHVPVNDLNSVSQWCVILCVVDPSMILSRLCAQHAPWCPACAWHPVHVYHSLKVMASRINSTVTWTQCAGT